MNPKLKSNAVGNERMFRSISYILVFLMMTCVVLTTGILIHNVLPNWRSGVIAGILLFIVVDRLYMYRQVKSMTPLSTEWAIAVGVQWIVIVLLSRLLLSYANGPDALARDLSLFARGYIGDLFTPEFVIVLFLAFVVWVLPTQFLELLDEIGLDMKSASSEDPSPIQSDAVSAHQRLVNQIFSVGIAVVILAVLTRINLSSVLSNGSGLQVSRFSGGEAGALLYFVFGLALLSLSRLMSLQTHWNRLHIPVSSHNLPRQWLIYSLFFLIILAVIVSLLPAGDSLGFFSVIGTLFVFLFGAIVFISQLIVALILFVFSLPFLLFGKAPPIMHMPMPVTVPPLAAPPASPTTGSPLWELFKSIILWGSLVAIIVFSFIRFVRQHETILAALRRSRFANWLSLAWQWLYRNAEKTRESLSRVIVDGWQSIVSRLDGKHILPPAAFISLRSLDPRRRIYFFYLAMIRRSGEQGLTRTPSQTPSEYAATLEKALPSASEDIDSITEAFIQARYSRKKVDARQADSVKGIWERIRRALRGKLKSDRSARK